MHNIPMELASFLDEMFIDPSLDRNPAKPAPVKAPESSFQKDEHGVWTLIHCGKCLGWINRVKDDVTYRAVSSVTHTVERFYSLENARSFLFEQSH